jgi:hypothetical protein
MKIDANRKTSKIPMIPVLFEEESDGTCDVGK